MNVSFWSNQRFKNDMNALGAYVHCQDETGPRDVQSAQTERPLAKRTASAAPVSETSLTSIVVPLTAVATASTLTAPVPVAALTSTTSILVLSSTSAAPILIPVSTSSAVRPPDSVTTSIPPASNQFDYILNSGFYPSSKQDYKLSFPPAFRIC
jgi:hypothetical protein